MTKFADIETLLPHQVPMILIDKVIDVTELTIHCQVQISDSGGFFDPQINAVPAWVGIEFMAQTVAAWSGYHASLKGQVSPIGFLLGSRCYNSECSDFPLGIILDIFAEQVVKNEGLGAFACTIECNGKALASSQLNVFVPAQDKLQKMLQKNRNKE